MTSQEQHVLDEFYKNAVMGADATSTILPKAVPQRGDPQPDAAGSCAASPAK